MPPRPPQTPRLPAVTTIGLSPLLSPLCLPVFVGAEPETLFLSAQLAFPACQALPLKWGGAGQGGVPFSRTRCLQSVEATPCPFPPTSTVPTRALWKLQAPPREESGPFFFPRPLPRRGFNPQPASGLLGSSPQTNQAAWLTWASLVKTQKPNLLPLPSPRLCAAWGKK